MPRCSAFKKDYGGVTGGRGSGGVGGGSDDGGSQHSSDITMTTMTTTGLADMSCGGIVKPDIVFFGEALPKRFFQYFFDFPRADLLIVMGTSLEVQYNNSTTIITSLEVQ